MANVKFIKCIASPPTYPTSKDKYDSLVPHDTGTFYLVDTELYLGDTLLSADMATEIGVADTDGHFEGVDVEAVLAELYADQLAKTVYMADASAGQSDYAKIYKIYQGSTGSEASPEESELIGTINIPLDKVVRAGSVVVLVYDESDGKLYDGDVDVTDIVVPTGGTVADYAGTYIKLELQNVEDPLYISVKDLATVYTGGSNSETTIQIDAHGEITATINKIDATKVIYQAGSAESYEQLPTDGSVAYDAEQTYYVYDSVNEQYDVETVVDAADYATKVASPGLWIRHEAVPEINIKGKVDQVEADLTALDTYVGKLPPTAVATTVVGYVDEKAGTGVGMLNGEAVIATKNATTNVITLKGGVVETEGIIENSATVPKATIVEGYKNPADGEFYEESTYETKITPDVEKSYKDLADAAEPIYNWTGHAYVLIREDISLVAVAVTGAAEDASYSNTTSQMIATNVQDAIDELSDQLTWNEV